MARNVNGVGSRVFTWYFMTSNGCGTVGSLLCIIYGQWLHMHVPQMTQPRGLIILTNPAKTAHRHCQQLNHMSLHWIKYVTKARKVRVSETHAVLFAMSMGKFPWLSMKHLHRFCLGAAPCQGISCTSRKRTEGFCDRGRKETRMTGRLVIKALDFEKNCAALTPRSCARG